MSLRIQTKPKTQTIVAIEKQPTDLIIIGGGPAGLSAAIYALRAKLNTILIEKMVLGGAVASAYRIENYPGFPEGLTGLELSQNMAKQVDKLGLRIIWGSVDKLSKDDGGAFHVQLGEKTLSSRAVIIASGSEPAKLGIPGEDVFRGKGVSYCATCDGPFYQGKNIIVVGGGNSAVEEALFLTKFANKVSIVHRRNELRADKILAEKALNHPKIYFFWHSTLDEIKGKKTVSEVVIKDVISDKRSTVPIDGVFIYTGNNPNTGFLKDLVKLDENKCIVTDDKMMTSEKGIFAAGDIRQKNLRQVITAASDGAIAAHFVNEYLAAERN
ncbi:MAG: thioredoxin-disulfide reductase [Candidatus Margulisiibacteriota bacterium]